MDVKKILQEIADNIDVVVAHNTPLGHMLWQAFLDIHPADSANFLEDIAPEQFHELFSKLPKDHKIELFKHFSPATQVQSLGFMNDQEVADSLSGVTADELTDLFDLFTDEELKKYLNVLHARARQEVVTLLKFHHESAGGIMDTRVLTLMEDFTVEKSVKILQRLRPRRDIHQRIYVTDNAHRLVGYVQLEDLVLHDPKDRISSFVHNNELVAQADQDREEIANQMVHYGLMTVPVVGSDNYFLGVIPSQTLVDVLVEEASEDVQKMSALTPMKYPYFETSFWRLLFERSYILIALLLAESISGTIVRAYEGTLGVLLLSFIPMIISTGGNTSSQTSAIAIQGMASGDIRSTNVMKFLKRELHMAIMLATVLGVVAFVRVYATTYAVMHSAAVSLALAGIVLTSVVLGSCIPLVFKRLNIDPAFSAGPLLATIMDILGILIFCYISKLLLA